MDTASLEFKELQRLIPECKKLAKEFDISLSELILARMLLKQDWINNNIVSLYDKL